MVGGISAKRTSFAKAVGRPPNWINSNDAGADVLSEWFDAYSGNLVGGTITTPYLLVDKDAPVIEDLAADGGLSSANERRYWDADESWELDPFTGEMRHAGQRLPFTCVLPKAELGFPQPYPVMWYGHGYGSNRLEVLLFAGGLNRFGIAACAFDFPGHGIGLPEDELALVEELLDAAGLTPTIQHFFEGRQRDLDNDGVEDSGGDQWTADPFHTRDMVRQGVVDWMQLNRTLRACGSGTMPEIDRDPDGIAVVSDRTRVSCDFDDDGVPDIGGTSDIYVIGGSLGGINAAVAAASLPDVQAFVPVVPGAGLVDVGSRTRIGGAVEAFVGRLISPLFLGLPEEDGRIRIVQMVNSVTNMSTLTMGWLDEVPVGGEIVVTNLTNGVVRRGVIPDDGRFRLTVPCDAMNAGDKADAAGIPHTGPLAGEVYEVPGNEGLGDQLIVDVYDADGVRVATFDRWPEDTVHEGVTMRAGSPLVAGNEGNGRTRGETDARRLAYVSAAVLEPGDPLAYASHYFLDPFPELGTQNVLIMPTPGDDQVPVNAGVALGRIAGVVPWDRVDDRYGTTVDQWLIDRQVVRGSEERGPWVGSDGNPALFDIDDLDDGTDAYGAPSDAPLRMVVPTSAGVSGFRMPYVRPTGTHGFGPPDPTLDFDINTYALTQIADYLVNRGQILEDRPCYEDASCADFPTAGGAP
jgi:hypothetical protein